MMYFFLIIFLVSLSGIFFMVGRKMLLIKKGYVFEEREWFNDEEYIEEVKRSLGRGIKIFGLAVLVISIRLYVKFINFVKNLYQQAVDKIKEIRARRAAQNGTTPAPKEASKFLAMVAQYKRKVRRIKAKVQEEENQK